MAYLDRGVLEQAVLGGQELSGEVFLQLGLMYSTGRTVPVDRVSAHKWFNLAAARGSRQAVDMRRELAGEMNDAEIADAQRAARLFLTRH